MARILLTALFSFAVVASPLEERAVNCNAVNSIVTIMKQQRVVTPYCSSLLKIPTVTSTATQYSTPSCATITQYTSSVSIVTEISSNVIYGTTTVYPVVAVSVTSMCALGATHIPTTTPPPARMAKRAPAPPSPPPPLGASKTRPPPPPPPAKQYPLARPDCLYKYDDLPISSACSCLNIPTPTKVTVAIVTLPAKTITTVIAQTAQVTVTSMMTTTSFTSTYSATQYYTSTFSVLSQPSSTLVPPADSSEVFGVYDKLDFIGLDLDSFFCYAGGPAPPSPYPDCTDFSGCVNACAFYNKNNLGASSNTKCGAVVYNAPPDGSSGSCYLKTGQVGCGNPNDMITSGVLLPLVPNDPQ